MCADDYISQQDVRADSAASARRNEDLWLDRGGDFGHQLLYGCRGTVVRKMQSALDKQYFGAANLAGEVESQAVVVALHLR